MDDDQQGCAAIIGFFVIMLIISQFSSCRSSRSGGYYDYDDAPYHYGDPRTTTP